MHVESCDSHDDWTSSDERNMIASSLVARKKHQFQGPTFPAHCAWGPPVLMSASSVASQQHQVTRSNAAATTLSLVPWVQWGRRQIKAGCASGRAGTDSVQINSCRQPGSALQPVTLLKDTARCLLPQELRPWLGRSTDRLDWLADCTDRPLFDWTDRSNDYWLNVQAGWLTGSTDRSIGLTDWLTRLDWTADLIDRPINWLN